MSLYSTIVADPPWKIKAGRSLGIYQIVDGVQVFGVADDLARDTAYPSMSVSDICALQVPAAANAHLYLWTINSYLEDAFTVVREWGFNYSTTLVWVKAPMGGGLGGAYGLATEYVLFARRGRLKSTARMGRNWFECKRPYDIRGKPRHSAKPPEFYEMIRTMSPGPYLEMFARDTREGWHVWGDEVTSDCAMTAQQLTLRDAKGV